MVHDGCIDPWRNSEHGGQGMKLNTSDWNSRRGYVRNALPGNVDVSEAHFVLVHHVFCFMVYRCNLVINFCASLSET